MSGFLPAALSLVVILVGSLLFAWRRGGAVTASGDSRRQANVALYHEHLAELETALAQGALDQDRFQHLKAELDRQLLNEASEQDPAARSSAALPA